MIRRLARWLPIGPGERDADGDSPGQHTAEITAEALTDLLETQTELLEQVQMTQERLDDLDERTELHANREITEELRGYE